MGVRSEPKLDRRRVLKSLAIAGGFSPTINRLAARAAEQNEVVFPQHSRNPRWFGFNLLEYFSTDPDWMKLFPYRNDGNFLEDDFRWIRDWGFNFVRLPMDYRFWTAQHDLLQIDDRKVEPIDRAIRLGEQFGIHICVSLHRAPGFCILDDNDASITGIHVTRETKSLFRDEQMLGAFVHQWSYFAARYKGISPERLSFNLVNEPIYRATPEERTQWTGTNAGDSQAVIDKTIRAEEMKRYARVASAAIAAIRTVDKQRPIVVDGFDVAQTPVPDLFDAGVVQSPHTYWPPEVTTFKAEWARQWLKRDETPTWPLTDSDGKTVGDRKSIERYLEPWQKAVQCGVPIHFGELGCYKNTPPDVALAWFEDTLEAIGELHAGWALWNFRGPFGILDTQRPGTKYERWYNHDLDRPLLSLLRRKTRA